MMALAATRFCSAARMSGRRSSNEDGNPGGHRRRLLLLSQRAPARHCAGVSAQQQADLVLGLLDQPLDVGNRLRRAVNQLLALPNIQKVATPPCCRIRIRLQRLLASGQRAPGDLQLHVQFEQIEVGGWQRRPRAS